MRSTQEDKYDDQLIETEYQGILICCYKGCGRRPDWIISRDGSDPKTWHPYACDEHYTILTNLCRKVGIRYRLRPYTPEEAERVYRLSVPLPLNIITGAVVIAVFVVAVPVMISVRAVKGILSKVPRKTS